MGKKFYDFFRFFLKSPESRIGPKNVKGNPLEFLNIHSVTKYQKIDGGPFEAMKKIS